MFVIFVTSCDLQLDNKRFIIIIIIIIVIIIIIANNRAIQIRVKGTEWTIYCACIASRWKNTNRPNSCTFMVWNIL